MRLPSLDSVPDWVLPTEFSVRKAAGGDADGLSEVLGAAFPEFGWNADKVRSELLEHPEVLSTFLIQRGERIVATASCKTSDEPIVGYLHWCAVHPDAQGARLGRMVCIAVLQEFAAGAMTSAILDTDDSRLPAVKTYLNLGFVPELRDDDDHARWQVVLAALEGH